MSARGQESRLLTNSLVILGVACCIGLVALSAIVNFRLGYRTADTELDGWIYGLGLVFADIVKALMPFFVMAAWRGGDRMAAICGALLFVLITASSLNGAIRFAAGHQSVREAEQVGETDRRVAVSAEIAERERKEKLLGTPRSPGEVEAAIAAIMAKPVEGSTVGTVSAKCSLERRSTRAACAEAAKLATERERALEWVANHAQLTKARDDLAGLAGKGSVGSDPQLDAVEGIIGWVTDRTDKGTVRLALLALFALVFELASGLGLYVVTTPWRLAEAANATTRETVMPAEQKQAELGQLDHYAHTRIDFVQGRRTPGTEVFADYRAWCRQEGRVALNEHEFRRAFEVLAAEIGIGSVETGGVRVFEDVGFVGSRERVD